MKSQQRRRKARGVSGGRDSDRPPQTSRQASGSSDDAVSSSLPSPREYDGRSNFTSLVVTLSQKSARSVLDTTSAHLRSPDTVSSLATSARNVVGPSSIQSRLTDAILNQAGTQSRPTHAASNQASERKSSRGLQLKRNNPVTSAISGSVVAGQRCDGEQPSTSRSDQRNTVTPYTTTSADESRIDCSDDNAKISISSLDVLVSRGSNEEVRKRTNNLVDNLHYLQCRAQMFSWRRDAGPNKQTTAHNRIDHQESPDSTSCLPAHTSELERTELKKNAPKGKKKAACTPSRKGVYAPPPTPATPKSKIKEILPPTDTPKKGKKKVMRKPCTPKMTSTHEEQGRTNEAVDKSSGVTVTSKAAKVIKSPITLTGKTSTITTPKMTTGNRSTTKGPKATGANSVTPGSKLTITGLEVTPRPPVASKIINEPINPTPESIVTSKSKATKVTPGPKSRKPLAVNDARHIINRTVYDARHIINRKQIQKKRTTGAEEEGDGNTTERTVTQKKIQRRPKQPGPKKGGRRWGAVDQVGESSTPLPSLLQDQPDLSGNVSIPSETLQPSSELSSDDQLPPSKIVRQNVFPPQDESPPEGHSHEDISQLENNVLPRLYPRKDLTQSPAKPYKTYPVKHLVKPTPKMYAEKASVKPGGKTTVSKPPRTPQPKKPRLKILPKALKQSSVESTPETSKSTQSKITSDPMQIEEMDFDDPPESLNATERNIEMFENDGNNSLLQKSSESQAGAPRERSSPEASANVPVITSGVEGTKIILPVESLSMASNGTYQHIPVLIPVCAIRPRITPHLSTTPWCPPNITSQQLQNITATQTSQPSTAYQPRFALVGKSANLASTSSLAQNVVPEVGRAPSPLTYRYILITPQMATPVQLQGAGQASTSVSDPSQPSELPQITDTRLGLTSVLPPCQPSTSRLVTMTSSTKTPPYISPYQKPAAKHIGEAIMTSSTKTPTNISMCPKPPAQQSKKRSVASGQPKSMSEVSVPASKLKGRLGSPSKRAPYKGRAKIVYQTRRDYRKRACFSPRKRKRFTRSEEGDVDEAPAMELPEDVNVDEQEMDVPGAKDALSNHGGTLDSLPSPLPTSEVCQMPTVGSSATSQISVHSEGSSVILPKKKMNTGYHPAPKSIQLKRNDDTIMTGSSASTSKLESAKPVMTKSTEKRKRVTDYDEVLQCQWIQEAVFGKQPEKETTGREKSRAVSRTSSSRKRSKSSPPSVSTSSKTLEGIGRGNENWLHLIPLVRSLSSSEVQRIVQMTDFDEAIRNLTFNTKAKKVIDSVSPCKVKQKIKEVPQDLECPKGFRKALSNQPKIKEVTQNLECPKGFRKALSNQASIGMISSQTTEDTSGSRKIYITEPERRNYTGAAKVTPLKPSKDSTGFEKRAAFSTGSEKFPTSVPPSEAVQEELPDMCRQESTRITPKLTPINQGSSRTHQKSTISNQESTRTNQKSTPRSICHPSTSWNIVAEVPVCEQDGAEEVPSEMEPLHKGEIEIDLDERVMERPKKKRGRPRKSGGVTVMPKSVRGRPRGRPRLLHKFRCHTMFSPTGSSVEGNDTSLQTVNNPTLSGSEVSDHPCAVINPTLTSVESSDDLQVNINEQDLVRDTERATCFEPELGETSKPATMSAKTYSTTKATTYSKPNVPKITKKAKAQAVKHVPRITKKAKAEAVKQKKLLQSCYTLLVGSTSDSQKHIADLLAGEFDLKKRGRPRINKLETKLTASPREQMSQVEQAISEQTQEVAVTSANPPSHQLDAPEVNDEEGDCFEVNEVEITLTMGSQNSSLLSNLTDFSQVPHATTPDACSSPSYFKN